MTMPRLITAMITPFEEDGRVNYSGAQELALHLLKEGSEGLLISGTTGESPNLSWEEKLGLFKAVKEAVGDKGTIIAGIGSNNTSESIRLGKEAEKIGVDGIMAVTPYYNKPNQFGIYEHFKAIAQGVSLPVMLYNVPGRTGINMLPDTVEKLAKIENITALKEASGNLDQVSAIIRVLPEDFQVFSGDDSLTLPIMSVGGCGVVSVASHVAGNQIKKMIYSFIAGQIEEAMLLHHKLFNLFRTMFITTNPIPVKYATKLLGLPAGGLRLPLTEVDREDAEAVRKAMEEIGLLKK